MYSSSSQVFAAGLAIFIYTTNAQSNDSQSSGTECNNTVQTSHNSSTSVKNTGVGQYSIPGFYAPGNGTVPPANWTYTIGVEVHENSSSSNTNFWVGTPDGTDPTSQALPYHGCMAAYMELPQSTAKRGQDDNGDCTKTFDQKCVDALTAEIKQSASLASGTDDKVINVCANLGRGPPDECKKYFGDVSGPSVSAGKSSA